MPTLAKKHKRFAPIGWRGSLHRHWLGRVMCERESPNYADTHCCTWKMVQLSNLIKIKPNYQNQFFWRTCTYYHLTLLFTRSFVCIPLSILILCMHVATSSTTIIDGSHNISWQFELKYSIWGFNEAEIFYIHSTIILSAVVLNC